MFQTYFEFSSRRLLCVACLLMVGCSSGGDETDGSTTSVTTATTTGTPTTESGETAETTADPTTEDPTTTTTEDPTGSESDSDSTTTDGPTTTTESETEDPTTTTGEPGCGNGVLEEDLGELCDGDEFAVYKCKDLDPQKYSSGDLKCTILCKYDYTDCEQIPCLAPDPADHLPCDDDSDEFLHAIGINCFEVDPQLYNAENSLYASNFVLLSPDETAWRVVKQFGTHYEGNVPFWSPTEGDRFLLVSNGSFPAVDLNGRLTAPQGSAQSGGNTNNDNPSNVMVLPGDMTPQQGSNNGDGGTPFMDCDGMGDCSDTLDAQWNLGAKVAHDVIYFEFTMKVPDGTFGYEFDFAFFSAEYPEFASEDASYNDFTVVWSVSESYTGNVAFLFDEDDNAQPLTVTALASNGLIEFGPNDPQLNGTGYDAVGGSTNWIGVLGSAVPKENITLSFTVFDKVDAEINTALALDNFRWSCGGCDISQVDSCGVVE